MNRIITDRISDNAMSDTQLARVYSILISETNTLARMADRYEADGEMEAATQAWRDIDAIQNLLAIVVNEQGRREIDAQVPIRSRGTALRGPG